MHVILTPTHSSYLQGNNFTQQYKESSNKSFPRERWDRAGAWLSCLNPAVTGSMRPQPEMLLQGRQGWLAAQQRSSLPASTIHPLSPCILHSSSRAQHPPSRGENAAAAFPSSALAGPMCCCEAFPFSCSRQAPSSV